MTNGSGGNPFRAMLDVGSALVSSIDLDEAFANVARTIGEAMIVAAVEIHSFDQKQNAFFLEASWALESDTVATIAAPKRVPIPVAERPDLRRVTARHELFERRSDDAGAPKKERDELEAMGVKSVLYAPLRVGREVLGVLSLIETRFARRWAPMEQDLLVQLCGLAAIAIRNAQLLRERDERTRHMQLLLDVGRAVTSSLVLDDVLKAVCQYIGQAMDVASCDIQLHDEESDRLIYAACWDRDPEAEEPMIGAIIDPDERPSNRLALEGKPIECHIDDPDLPELERAGLERWGEKTTLDFPLKYQDEVIGILGLVELDHVRRFTYEERALFDQLGVLASIAIRNAQAYRQQEDQTRHVESLLAIGRCWTTCCDADELFITIAREAATALRAPRSLLYEYDGDLDTVTLRGIHTREPLDDYDTTGQAEPLDDHPGYRRILASGSPVVERLSDADLDEATRAEMERWSETTALNLPLVFRGEPLGILMVVETNGERLYSEAELRLAGGIAEQATVALRAARELGTGAAGGAVTR